MKVLSRIQEIQKQITDSKGFVKSLGLVPTMGALHA